MRTTHLTQPLGLLIVAIVGAALGGPSSAADRVAVEKASLPVLAALQGPFPRSPDALVRLSSTPTFAVTSVAFSPTAHLLVAASKDQLTFWDLATGWLVHDLPGYTDDRTARQLAFSPDGAHLAVACADGQVRIIASASGDVVRALPAGGILLHVGYSADGQRLNALRTDLRTGKAAVSVWRADTWEKKEWSFNHDDRAPWAVSPSGLLLAQPVSDAQGMLRAVEVRDLTTGEVTTIKTPRPPRGLGFSSDGQVLLVSVPRDERNAAEPASELWELGVKGGEPLRVQAIEAPAAPFRLSPDGQWLTFFPQRQVSLVDRTTGRERWSGMGGPSAELSPGMQLLAIPQSTSVVLLAFDELLHESWADAAAGVALARSLNLTVSLYAGRMRLRVERAPVADRLARAVAALPGLTDVFLSLGAPLTKADLTPLKDLAGLQELTLYGVEKIEKDALEPLRGMKPLRRFSLSDCREWVGPELVPLADVPNLEAVGFPDCRKLTDQGLKPLAGLKSLQAVTLRGCAQVSDEGLAHLAGLGNLRALDLSDTGVRSGGLVHLKNLRRLEKLNLYECGVRDEALAVLADLTELTDLTLSRNGTTDAGLAHLKNHTRLQRLTLREGGRLTAVGLGYLKGCKDLEFLDLDYADVDDDTLTALAAFPHLKQLQLEGTLVTDAGLKHLAGLTELTRLRLAGKRIRGAGLASLKDRPLEDDLSLSLLAINDQGMEAVGHLKHLRRLWLPRDVTEAGMKHLAGLEHLEELRVSQFQRHLTGDALRHVARLPRLKKLHLLSASIDDTLLPHLAEMKHLRDLNLSGTSVTAKCLPVLKGLPDLRILSLPKDPSIPPEKVEELRRAMPFTMIP